MIVDILNYFIDKFNQSLEDVTDKDILRHVVRNPFSKYLPMRAYDPDKQQYFNIDGTIGFLWEFSPITYASKTVYRNLEGVLNSMPPKSVFQIILHSDPYIEPILESYLSIRRKDYAALGSRTAAFFRDAAKSGTKNMAGIPVRNFRCFAALKLSTAEKKESNIQFLRDSVQEALKSANLSPRSCHPQEICQWLQRVLLAQSDWPILKEFQYREERPINRQVIPGGMSLKSNFDHMEIGDHIVKVHTVKEYPKESLNDLTMNQVFGGIMGAIDDATQYPFPFLISVNIVKEDISYKVQGKTNLTAMQEKKGASAGHKHDRQSELFWVVREMDRGTQFVRVIPTIISFNKDLRSASENSARIRRRWENLGFSLNNDRGIILILFLASLPFGFYYTKKLIDTLDRDRIMPVESAARMLPIQGDFCGIGKPVTLFIGRKGQIQSLDIFHRDAPNNNVIIAAKTGKGKSYLMNRLLIDYLSSGAKIRMFDLGKSYKKLCERVNGVFLEFTKDSRHCINPFCNVRDINEDIGLLSLIISQMAWSSSGGRPSETQNSILKAAIRDVWSAYGPDGVDHIDFVQLALMDFKAVLKRQNFSFDQSINEILSLARELAFNLNDFTKRNNGPYGRWFNGQSTLNITDEVLVVFELEELRLQPSLFNPVSMQVVNYTTQSLYLSDRSTRYIIGFDEAWKWFVEGSFLGDVIEEGYRIARKYFASFITIFQSLLDLKAFGRGGDVIRENSAFHLLLHSDYRSAQAKGMIDHEEFVMKLLDSVDLQKGRYSEIFVKTPFSMGVSRLPQDFYAHMLFTSDPRENREINQIAQKYNIPPVEAIEYLEREYRKSA